MMIMVHVHVTESVNWFLNVVSRCPCVHCQ